MIPVTELALTTGCRPLTLQDCCDGLAVPPPAGNDGLAVQPRAGDDGAALIGLLLRDQQQLTAVEEFSQAHDQVPAGGAAPSQARYYARLLPATPPGPGQQYGFEVDLDRCSGCKACVTACHALNGLDDKETWRDVGLLIGGTELLPVMQHVTAACHHCVEPGCMNACPVDAYEKDPVTGIVRHLDDQCFGCQYCTLACPYDVPRYHAGKGIVRKCDMCSGRLSAGEAPACVQACPHEAIAIRVVDVARVMENAEADHFLPAAPEPHLTFPTTTYKSRRVFPRNMLPADYYSISPQHPHMPLVIMLVMTQLSVGTFATGCFLERSVAPHLLPLFRPLHATIALAMGLLALGASTLHLGRPQFAFRGIIGLRHSWLSREILAFGLFAGLAVPYAALCWMASVPRLAELPWGAPLVSRLPELGVCVAVVGAIGVFCSAMIYVFTKREIWNLERTFARFVLTSAVLGIATVWVSVAILEAFAARPVGLSLADVLTVPLTKALMAASALKIGFDLLLLRHRMSFRNSPMKRSALLVLGPLAGTSFVRLVAGIVGGIVVPFWILTSLRHVDGLRQVGLWPVLLAWIGCFVAELAERYLFFAAASAARMPGGVRS